MSSMCPKTLAISYPRVLSSVKFGSSLASRATRGSRRGFAAGRSAGLAGPGWPPCGDLDRERRGWSTGTLAARPPACWRYPLCFTGIFCVSSECSISSLSTLRTTTVKWSILTVCEDDVQSVEDDTDLSVVCQCEQSHAIQSEAKTCSQTPTCDTAVSKGFFKRVVTRSVA